MGEELTRVPSLTSLQEAEQTEQTGEPLSRVPSLTSLFSDFNFDCEHEQEAQTDESTEAEKTEQTGEPLSRVPSLASLFSDFNFDCGNEQEAQADESIEVIIYAIVMHRSRPNCLEDQDHSASQRCEGLYCAFLEVQWKYPCS